MSLAYIEKWYNSLPEGERDLPILSCCGRLWTPREILQQVRSGQPPAELLQRLIESKQVAPGVGKEALTMPLTLALSTPAGRIALDVAKARLMQVLEKYKSWKIGTLSVPGMGNVSVYTILNNLKAGVFSPEVVQLLDAERSVILRDLGVE